MHFRYRAIEGSSYEQCVPGGLELLRVSVTLRRMSFFFFSVGISLLEEL